MNSSDKKIAHHRFIAVGLLLVFFAIIYLIFASRPTATRFAPDKKAQITIDVERLERKDVPISIHSYGLVRPLTQTSLVARVSGVISYIDEDMREGGAFEKGQLLVSLEKDDYLIELDIAKAQVAEAQSRYETEKAQAYEAKLDWQRSGRKGEAPALALRQPQLKAAEAGLKSAEAAFKRAQLNLQRTDIYAPFNGRVLELNVGLAQVIGANAVLAEVFSSDAAEIKLPIKSQDYAFLELPLKEGPAAPKVDFTAQFAGEQQWQGHLVRASGAIDESSRQMSVVARIEQPFVTQEQGTRGLKVGEYVTATIQGRVMDGVLVIPNSAIYQGSYVYVHVDGKVERRNVSVGWSDDQNSLIESGLQEGDELVTTPLGRVTSGTLVKVSGHTEAKPEQVKSTKENRGKAASANN